MRYNADKGGYVGSFLAAVSLGGCEKEPSNQQLQPQTLETVVHASAKVDVKDELDLSTPEKAIDLMFRAGRNNDLALLKKIITKYNERDINDFLAELRSFSDYKTGKRQGNEIEIDLYKGNEMRKGVIEIVFLADGYHIAEVAPK